MLGVTAMEFAQNRSSNLQEKASRVLSAMFRNPFVIGIALGLIVNVTNLPPPAPIMSGIELVANAALPSALFGLGGILFRLSLIHI